MDRGTIIRTILLGFALINQLLLQFNFDPIPGDHETWYHIVSTIFTVGVSIWTWFKNNYITFRGLQQKEVLVKNGLAEA